MQERTSELARFLHCRVSSRVSNQYIPKFPESVTRGATRDAHAENPVTVDFGSTICVATAALHLSRSRPLERTLAFRCASF
jgi:hypothetical protein